MLTKALITTWNTETGEAISEKQVSTWYVESDGEFQSFDGITIAYDDGIDISITDETLAAMGYVRA